MSAEVVRFGLASIQVCVPKSFTDAEVEDFANAAQPTGISSRWVMRHTGDPALAGDAERVQCSEHSSHVHVMLDC